VTIEARKTLFRHSRPNIRAMELADVGWLWAAHKLQGKPDMSREEFMTSVSSSLESFPRIYIAEDANAQFSGGVGPIGIFVANYDGWNLEPHVEFFPWATSRNRVKAVVSFLIFQRFQKEVGCIQIHASVKFREFFKRLKKYVPIRVGGKIEGGRPDGADYIFYIRGKREH
jgi:hypothetical protein